MPIPKPRYGETTDQFMSRCMGTATMKTEYPDVRQRAAVCRTQVKARMTDEHETNYLDTIAEIKAYHDDEDEDKGEFEGYASIFGNKDLGNDVVDMGAFKRSLRRRGAKGVKLLYQHDTKQPIGVFDKIKEDAQYIIVTHQQQTMHAGDVLYGVTMEPGSGSRVFTKTKEDFESLIGTNEK